MPTPIAYFSENAQIDGVVYTRSNTIISNGVVSYSPSVPAAKTGNLTTRTNDTDGTLTMDTGHGFVTADILDLYWGTGQRCNVVVGVVAGDSVPISGGSGDNLPEDESEITAMERNIAEDDYTFTGTDARAIVMSSPVPAAVHLVAADGTTVHLSVPLVADDGNPSKYVYTWHNENGVPNPITGDAIARIYVTHGSELAQTVTCIIHRN